MKAKEMCPKCEGRKLYVIDEVAQPAQESINLVIPLAVTTLETASDTVGLLTDNKYRAVIGRYQAWICASCGFTEWYAKDFEEHLEAAVRARVRGVRLVDRTRTPYR